MDSFGWVGGPRSALRFSRPRRGACKRNGRRGMRVPSCLMTTRTRCRDVRCVCLVTGRSTRTMSQTHRHAACWFVVKRMTMSNTLRTPRPRQGSVTVPDVACISVRRLHFTVYRFHSLFLSHRATLHMHITEHTATLTPRITHTPIL